MKKSLVIDKNEILMADDAETYIRERLKDAGFDLDRGMTITTGSDNTVYAQEEEMSLGQQVLDHEKRLKKLESEEHFVSYRNYRDELIKEYTKAHHIEFSVETIGADILANALYDAECESVKMAAPTEARKSLETMMIKWGELEEKDQEPYRAKAEYLLKHFTIFQK